jgi:hypothetical protein
VVRAVGLEIIQMKKVLASEYEIHDVENKGLDSLENFAFDKSRTQSKVNKSKVELAMFVSSLVILLSLITYYILVQME